MWGVLVFKEKQRGGIRGAVNALGKGWSFCYGNILRIPTDQR